MNLDLLACPGDGASAQNGVFILKAGSGGGDCHQDVFLKKVRVKRQKGGAGCASTLAMQPLTLPASQRGPAQCGTNSSQTVKLPASTRGARAVLTSALGLEQATAMAQSSDAPPPAPMGGRMTFSEPFHAAYDSGPGRGLRPPPSWFAKTRHSPPASVGP